MRCDLHRHLGGSISTTTVARLLKKPLKKVVKQMTYADGEEFNYDTFFDKFKILDTVEWTQENIRHTIEDVIWRLKSEKIEYSEIKFSVNKYLPYLEMDLEKTILWFANCFDELCSKWGIQIDLILSLKHDMDKAKQIEIGNVIGNDLIAECISGIDIVGNEKYFNVDFYKPIFQRWHDAGKACMAHVGEINKPQNVIDAVNHLHLDRVCHGIATADNKELAKKCRDRLIAFDLCLTSNICTGVANIQDHPINRMLDNEFLITIGTDDPIILDTNYDQEFQLFQEISKLSNEEVKMIQDSAYYFSAREITNRKQK